MIHWTWLFAALAVGIWYGFVLALCLEKIDPIEEGTRVVSSEDPRTEYVCFPDISLIFYEGVYRGWYLP